MSTIYRHLLRRFVRYHSDQGHSENDVEYLRVLNWHKWVCSSQPRVQSPESLAPIVWVNAKERCDDNTIAE